MPALSPSTFPSHDVQVKTFAVTTAMTAGTDKAFVIPRNSRIIGFVLSGTASNAGSTATLSVGTTSGTPTEFVNGVSVLSGGVGNGVNLLNGVASGVGGINANDVTIFVQYAETGTPSNAGGWQLFVLYTTGGFKASTSM